MPENVLHVIGSLDRFYRCVTLEVITLAKCCTVVNQFDKLILIPIQTPKRATTSATFNVITGNVGTYV